MNTVTTMLAIVCTVYSWGSRKEENAIWGLSEAKGACLRRLDERGFPPEMRAVAEASDRFFELGVYYRNPLEVNQQNNSRFACTAYSCLLLSLR